MGESFVVKLFPFEIQERKGNLTVTKSMGMDKVVIVTDNGQRHWGYCSDDTGTFQQLSGFPKELAPEVQRQINLLRGFAVGEGPDPPVILESGPTAQEQEFVEIEGEEEYE